MKRLASLFFTLVAVGGWALSASGEAVNFQIGTMEDPGAEGPGVTRYFISLGAKRISFRKPQHAQITSQPDNITVFLSENGLSGQFTIANSAFRASQEFIANADTYLAAAEATMPKEAKDAEFAGADPQPYTASGWPSQGFEWKYSYFAHPSHRRVEFIDLDEEHQICITIVSEEASWAATSALARRFLKSWYWMEDLQALRAAAITPPAAATPDAAAPPAAAASLEPAH